MAPRAAYLLEEETPWHVSRRIPCTCMYAVLLVLIIKYQSRSSPQQKNLISSFGATLSSLRADPSIEP